MLHLLFTPGLFLRLMLVACLPLCCCRVGMVMGMLAAEDDAGDARIVACGAVPFGCCDHDDEGRPPGDPESDHDDRVPGQCGHSCCIKGFVPAGGASDSPAAPLAAILPPQIIHRPLAGRADRDAIARRDWRPVDTPSLLRLRCALLI
ncbi:MAG: hypothetical protein SYC29_00620 [Planctomycetota bacterium]|nr:hypothetical protein [Planctomycetota bacterium]